MLDALVTSIKVVKDMGELPGLVYIGVGFLFSIISVFTIFIRPVEKPALFYLFLIIGIGFIFWGDLKFRRKRKKNDDELARKIQERASRPEDQPVKPPEGATKKKSVLPAELVNPGDHNVVNEENPAPHHGPFGKAITEMPAHAPEPIKQDEVKPSHHSGGHARRFCPHCGAPVDSIHKFCTSCGSRL